MKNSVNAGRIYPWKQIIMTQKASLFAPEKTYQPAFSYESLKHILTDRKSKYTVTGWLIRSRDEWKTFMKKLVREREFHKATHNTYAWRVQLEDGGIMEWKNDDGESWAWNCILREMQRASIVNCIVVVSRYYWWIQLHADRFKNVMEVSRKFVEEKVVL